MAAPLTAQAQNAVLGRGDAVVTGFSGIKPTDAPTPPGGNPLDEFFIDLDGASAQIQSLGAAGQPPQGQLISAPSKLQVKARQVGQVFAITLDDGRGAPVPNIYLGATSAFGLQIVLPDSDGDSAPERVTKGHPNAQWMAGQFGIDAGGGPGSIWRVDGQSGAASLFTTVPGNSGAGLGDVVFDRASRQFFASDLDSGLIYRIGDSGQILDSFDHGVSARPQNGLVPVSDDGSQIDIKNAAFDSLNPETWALTAAARRVHGLAVQDGRLYYTVDGQVWSLGVSPAGFGGDARWELDASGLAADGPITDMLFDATGRLYLAQRGAQRTSYDYSVLAEPEKSNVVRYRREQPDNPDTKSVWIEESEAYAIGLPPEHNHAEGGIALGYAHNGDGTLRYGACGEMLWSTGHRLRPGAEDAETPEADVHGLQGNDVSLVRPQNTPPQQSYFTDYDSLFGDSAKAGHIGDVEIWQPCQGAPDFASVPLLGPLPPGILPPGDFPPDLPPEFPPDYDFHTNLKLTKRATPKTCSAILGGWLCQYTVRVTNTGPDNYFGPVVVRDWLPASPAGAIMGFAPTPPWTCASVGPSDKRCWRFGVFLAPTWSIDLTAYVWVPKSYPKCHLTNAARIEWAPPGSIWNSDPTDDIDFASAIIPSKECNPNGKKTDLKIYKEAVIDCFEWAGGVRCAYKIRVENQGPGAYNGNIVVEDTIPNGATAIFSGPGWTTPCPNLGSVYSCTYPGASLPNPGDGVNLIVRVDLPAGLAKQFNCKVPNRAEIVQAPAGSDQNTDATNDKASAVASVPAKICHKRVPQTNLLLEKTVDANGCLKGVGVYHCYYNVVVTNTGPGDYNDKIVVNEFIPLGTTAVFTWNCMGGTCTHDPVLLKPNEKVVMGAQINVPDNQVKELNCKVTNLAKISYAPGGSDQNTDPTDDQGQATANLPASLCGSTVPSCPPGYSWTGERCVRPDPACRPGWTLTPTRGECCPPGKPWNQRLRQCGGDTPPPPPPACERGWTPTPIEGRCCPPGKPWTGEQCGRDVPPPRDCPDGYRGVYPNCWKPEGGQCERTQRCTNGMAWNRQACACICPEGRVMKRGQCVVDQPDCPPGTTGTPPRCRPIIRHCPPGMVGTPPDCHRRECPSGTRGIFPNCRKVIIDPPRHCPPGTRGRFPICRKVPVEQPRDCPRGMVGRYPNCRPVVRVCPPGTFGRPPHCRRIDVTRPGRGSGIPGSRPRYIPRPDGGQRQSPIR